MNLAKRMGRYLDKVPFLYAVKEECEWDYDSIAAGCGGNGFDLEIVTDTAVVLCILVSIIVWAVIAWSMFDIARQKGHLKKSVLFLTFFLGFAGILYTILLPDLVRRKQNEDLIAALRRGAKPPEK